MIYNCDGYWDDDKGQIVTSSAFNLTGQIDLSSNNWWKHNILQKELL